MSQSYRVSWPRDSRGIVQGLVIHRVDASAVAGMTLELDTTCSDDPDAALDSALRVIRDHSCCDPYDQRLPCPADVIAAYLAHWA